MKKCSRCGEDKPATTEYFSKSTRLGLQSWCKECVNANRKEKYDEKLKLQGKSRRESPWYVFTGKPVKCRKCGEIKPLTEENFRKGNKSNGSHTRKDCRECLNKQRRELVNKDQRTRAYALLLGYKRADSGKGLICDLTLESVIKLISQPCHYCGSTTKVGVDRIDNTSGHIVSNCVSCCQTCNLTRGHRFTFVEMVTEIGPAIKRIKAAREVSHIPSFPNRWPEGECRDAK